MTMAFPPNMQELLDDATQAKRLLAFQDTLQAGDGWELRQTADEQWYATKSFKSTTRPYMFPLRRTCLEALKDVQKFHHDEAHSAAGLSGAFATRDPLIRLDMPFDTTEVQRSNMREELRREQPLNRSAAYSTVEDEQRKAGVLPTPPMFVHPDETMKQRMTVSKETLATLAGPDGERPGDTNRCMTSKTIPPTGKVYGSDAALTRSVDTWEPHQLKNTHDELDRAVRTDAPLPRGCLTSPEINPSQPEPKTVDPQEPKPE